MFELLFQAPIIFIRYHNANVLSIGWTIEDSIIILNLNDVSILLNVLFYLRMHLVDIPFTEENACNINF